MRAVPEMRLDAHKGLCYGCSWCRRAGKRNRLIAGIVAGVLLLVGCAAAKADARPRAVLLLLRETDAGSFLHELSDQRWSKLRAGCAVAAMNCAVPGSDTGISAQSALLSGRRLDAAKLDHSTPNLLISALVGSGRRIDVSSSLDPFGDGLSHLPAEVRDDLAFLWLKTARFGVREVLLSADRLTGELDPERDLLIVTSASPGEPSGGQWMTLAPVLIWGKGWPAGLSTSTTTRTPGLLANTDIAPTILEHLGVPIPREMEGHPARPCAGTVEELRAFVRHERVNRETMVPVLLGWGGLALVAVGWVTAVLFRGGTSGQARTARVLLTAAASYPLAMLLAAAFPVPSEEQQVVRVTVLLGVITTLAAGFGRRGSPYMVVAGMLLAVMLVDLYAGTGMLERNLMSDFANIGARFYGIGNEYEGLALAASVLGPAWVLSNGAGKSISRPAWLTIGVLWALTAAGVGHPAMGADFGGAVSLCLTYLIAAAALRQVVTGKRIRLMEVAVALSVVAGLAALLVFYDLSRPPGQRTHLGELASRALQGEGRIVWEMVARKALLNVQMAGTGYFLLGMAALFPLLALWYHRIGRDAWTALSARPLLRAGVLSTFAGGVVMMLLNDTGVIAWALATGAGLFTWLDLMLASLGNERKWGNEEMG